MKSKIIFYECKSCESRVPANTLGKLTSCNCGKVKIEGNGIWTRLIGDSSFRKSITKKMIDKDKTFVFRIKDKRTEEFFASKGKFSKLGRFYSRKPSLAWIRYTSNFRSCVIERYELSNKSTIK